jgi:hypothetical protein
MTAERPASDSGGLGGAGGRGPWAETSVTTSTVTKQVIAAAVKLIRSVLFIAFSLEVEYDWNYMLICILHMFPSLAFQAL